MKRFAYAFSCGFITTGVGIGVPQMTGQGNILINMSNIGFSDSLIWAYIGLLFLIGYCGGWYYFGKKEEKREEEERRQAEQDRNNVLMRQYLERKLQEENEVNG